MAKKSKTDDLFQALRAQGVRKRVAKTISRLDPNPSTSTKARRRAESVLDDLRGAVKDVEGRLTGDSKRKQSGKKAAATRRRNAQARSRAAKKGAATRSRREKTATTRSRGKGSATRSRRAKSKA